MFEMKLEIDVLKEIIDVFKKDLGVDQKNLTDKEKAVIIDALKNKYSLQQLFIKLEVSKSSYYYFSVPHLII